MVTPRKDTVLTDAPTPQYSSGIAIDPAELWEEWLAETPKKYRTPQSAMAFAVDRLRSSPQAKAGEWDKGEHEGCGIDSQRASDRFVGVAQAGQDERRQARLERSGLDIPEAQTLDDVVAQSSPDRGKLVALIDAVKRLVDRHAETKEGSGILLIPAAPHELKRLRQALEPFRETATLAAELAPSPPAALPAGETPLAWLAEHKNCELSFSGWDEDSAWLLHSVNGGRNDREWTLLATGDTPEAALRKAMGRAMPSTLHQSPSDGEIYAMVSRIGMTDEEIKTINDAIDTAVTSTEGK